MSYHIDNLVRTYVRTVSSRPIHYPWATARVMSGWSRISEVSDSTRCCRYDVYSSNSTLICAAASEAVLRLVRSRAVAKQCGADVNSAAVGTPRERMNGASVSTPSPQLSVTQYLEVVLMSLIPWEFLRRLSLDLEVVVYWRLAPNDTRLQIIINHSSTAHHTLHHRHHTIPPLLLLHGVRHCVVVKRDRVEESTKSSSLKNKIK